MERRQTLARAMREGATALRERAHEKRHEQELRYDGPIPQHEQQAVEDLRVYAETLDRQAREIEDELNSGVIG